ncbi:hypothetical protein OROHE_006672 [Orobanche hederae]
MGSTMFSLKSRPTVSLVGSFNSSSINLFESFVTRL